MMLSVVAFGFMGGGYRSGSTAKIESEVIMCIQSHCHRGGVQSESSLLVLECSSVSISDGWRAAQSMY